MKIKKLIICSFLLLILFIFGLKYYPKNQQNYLEFKDTPDSILMVNGDEVYPKFSKDIKDYHSLSISTLTSNLMKFGDTTKPFNVKEINPKSPVIPFKIGKQTYNLHVWGENLAEFSTTGAINTQEGQYFLTTWYGKDSFAYIVNKNGKILYYRRNPEPTEFVSNFKKTTLKNGETYYSITEETSERSHAYYVYGKVLLMDENFQPIKRMQILPHKDHRELFTEAHDYLILGRNHYILMTYIEEEVLNPLTKEIHIYAFPLLQEIKNDKVVFEWNTRDYFTQLTTKKQWCNKRGEVLDCWHLNTVIIDPTDENFILSFRNISAVVKINRKTGTIMWILGGEEKDDFALSQKQRFSAQHSITKNGNTLLLFDNHNWLGNSKDRKSFIKQYVIDEKNKKVLDYTEFKLTFFADGMGSVEKTKENTYLVGTGSFENFIAHELDSNGTIVWLLKLKNKRLQNYYVHKY